MKHLFLNFLVIIMAFSFVACGDDEAAEPAVENNGTVAPDTPVPDPEGTITLAMRDEDNGDTNLGGMYIENENFAMSPYDTYFYDSFNSDFGYLGYIASIGAVNGLGNVFYIPKNGWARKVAVIPGHGYVMFYMGIYYRIYVIDYIGSTINSIIGANIKYQQPFKGTDETIKISNSTVTFPHIKYTNSYNQKIIWFENSNFVSYTVGTREGGYNVYAYPVAKVDAGKFYNGVAILCYGSATTGEVTITTAYGKTTTIKVIHESY